MGINHGADHLLTRKDNLRFLEDKHSRTLLILRSKEAIQEKMKCLEDVINIFKKQMQDVIDKMGLPKAQNQLLQEEFKHLKLIATGYVNTYLYYKKCLNDPEPEIKELIHLIECLQNEQKSIDYAIEMLENEEEE